MAIQAADIKRRFTLLALRAVKMSGTFPRRPVGDVVITVKGGDKNARAARNARVERIWAIGLRGLDKIAG